MSKRATSSFTYALQEAVKERGPDWRYPSNDDDPDRTWHDENNLAVYRRPDGTPGCIIGAALFRLLPPTTPPSEHDGARMLLLRLGFDERTATAAACAQIHQDWGFTWGDCQIVYVEALQLPASSLADAYAEVIERLWKKTDERDRWLARRELQA